MRAWVAVYMEAVGGTEGGPLTWGAPFVRYLWAPDDPEAAFLVASLRLGRGERLCGVSPIPPEFAREEPPIA